MRSETEQGRAAARTAGPADGLPERSLANGPQAELQQDDPVRHDVPAVAEVLLVDRIDRDALVDISRAD